MKLLILISALLSVQDPEPPRGHLVIVGGGGTPDAVLTRTLKLAGGMKARIVVVPQASRREDAGKGTADMFREAGAKNVTVLSLDDNKAAVASVKRADLIWMPGGSQERLMDALKDTGVPGAIVDRYREGAVVGGTSAGAAIMSKVMLTGDRVIEGLGLWSEAIVDQHFLARKRFNRLLAAVLGRPKLLGVGIDEKTAVVVTGSEFEVLGRSRVLVLDARKTKVEKGEPPAATDMMIHVLRAGMKFDWVKGVRTK